MNPRLVIRTMQDIKRKQVTDSSMDAQAVRFIFDNGLMRKTEWPAWVISVTEAGATYIAGHGDDES